MTEVETKKLLVFGASGHGLVIAEAAQASGWEVIGFCDDGVATGQQVGAWAVLDETELSDPELRIIVGIGSNPIRRKVALRLVGRFATVVHPSAVVSPSAHLGEGVFVGPLSVIHAEARIGEGAIVNSGSVVEHHAVVGAYAHIAPGAVLAGAVRVGDETLIGANAAVIPGCEIGHRATVGAGAAVIGPVADDSVVVGTPARSR